MRRFANSVGTAIAIAALVASCSADGIAGPELRSGRTPMRAGLVVCDDEHPDCNEPPRSTRCQWITRYDADRGFYDVYECP